MRSAAGPAWQSRFLPSRCPSHRFLSGCHLDLPHASTSMTTSSGLRGTASRGNARSYTLPSRRRGRRDGDRAGYGAEQTTAPGDVSMSASAHATAHSSADPETGRPLHPSGRRNRLDRRAPFSPRRHADCSCLQHCRQYLQIRRGSCCIEPSAHDSGPPHWVRWSSPCSSWPRWLLPPSCCDLLTGLQCTLCLCRWSWSTGHSDHSQQHLWPPAASEPCLHFRPFRQNPGKDVPATTGPLSDLGPVLLSGPKSTHDPLSISSGRWRGHPDGIKTVCATAQTTHTRLPRSSLLPKPLRTAVPIPR